MTTTQSALRNDRRSGLNKIRVYLVDDLVLVRAGLKAMLKPANDLDVVGEAGDGETALHQLKSLPVDVVLMDVGMPGIDGIETTRRLKESFPDVKVLVLTSQGGENLEAALEACASGYLLKRADRNVLTSAIREVYQGGAPLDPQVARKLVQRFQRPAIRPEIKPSESSKHLVDSGWQRRSPHEGPGAAREPETRRSIEMSAQPKNERELDTIDIAYNAAAKVLSMHTEARST